MVSFWERPTLSLTYFDATCKGGQGGLAQHGLFPLFVSLVSLVSIVSLVSAMKKG